MHHKSSNKKKLVTPNLLMSSQLNAVKINFIETTIHVIDAHFKRFMFNKNYAPDVYNSCECNFDCDEKDEFLMMLQSSFFKGI